MGDGIRCVFPTQGYLIGRRVSYEPWSVAVVGTCQGSEDAFGQPQLTDSSNRRDQATVNSVALRCISARRYAPCSMTGGGQCGDMISSVGSSLNPVVADAEGNWDHRCAYCRVRGRAQLRVHIGRVLTAGDRGASVSRGTRHFDSSLRSSLIDRWASCVSGER